MAEKTKSVFEKLNSINVNDHTEEKNGLTYLSWAWAWTKVKAAYPDASYEIIKFDGKPWLESDEGYMVFTKVTILSETLEMWLPVMDPHKKSMKREPYRVTQYNKYKRKEETYTVPACSTFDINTAIMRCLTKNLGMFGLGLYIYAGEDIPEDEQLQESTKAKDTKEKQLKADSEKGRKPHDQNEELDIVPTKELVDFVRRVKAAGFDSTEIFNAAKCNSPKLVTPEVMRLAEEEFQRRLKELKEQKEDVQNEKK